MTFVEGTVLEIIYRNDENGYTVLEIDADGKMAVCVGNLPPIQPGEYARFYGAYTVHKTYGEQFKVASMESKMPEGDESIRLFLSGGLIKGIGEVMAARIVAEFHGDTFDILENHPEMLASVRGISPASAKKMQLQFRELTAVRGVIIDLQGLGLTVRQAMACYEAYGQAAAAIIRGNPYRLMDDIRGIGFEKADQIASGMELPNYAELRLYNGIKHLFMVRLGQGHTCYPAQMLEKEAAAMLDAAPDDVHAAMLRLIAADAVVERTYNGVAALAIAQAYGAEAMSAFKLVQLSKAQPAIELDMAAIEGMLQGDLLLSEEQERAILSALSRTVSVITGGPGTGKTTILNQIITALERSGVATVLAAPTGRAAKRMENATGRQAKTIHRLLEYGFSPDEDAAAQSCRFARDEENPIEADAIIIDELSMVDIFLLRSLLAAIEPGKRLILTGDYDQLPSVGAGNVLKDIIASGVVPVFRLTEVFRQQGNIAMAAQHINRGEEIDLFDAGDFVFLPTSSAPETVETVKRLYLARLDEGIPMEQVQVICPLKKGAIGVYAINTELREALNPRMLGRHELRYGDTIYREGDKIMQTANNYSKEWRLMGAQSLSRGTGAYNGDIGMIQSIDEEEKTVDILFEGERLAQYAAAELEQIEHSYAVTVHKSQGSEFDTVILPLFYGGNDFLTRNLLYTAVTRARTKLFIVGTRRAVQCMVKNSRINRRFTALKYEMAEYSALSDKIGNREAVLQDEYERLEGLFGADPPMD